MATQTQNYKIRRTEIDIPHNNSIITFVYDKRCQGAYSHATDFILRNMGSVGENALLGLVLVKEGAVIAKITNANIYKCLLS